MEKKLLPPLSGPQMVAYPARYRENLFNTARTLVMARYPEESDVQLTFSARLRAHLLRAGDIDNMVALARVEQQITAHMSADTVSWEGMDALVHLVVELCHHDGSPMEFQRKDGRVLWVPGGSLRADDLPDAVLDVTEEMEQAKVLLLAKRRGAPEDITVRPVGSMELRPGGTPERWRLAYVGEARVPLEDLFRLHHKAGSFVVDFHVEFNLLGWRSMRRLAASADQSMPVPCPDDPDLASFYRTEMGNLSLRVRRPAVLPKRRRPPLARRLAPRRIARGLRRRWVSARGRL